ncbi:NAD-dependent epimerase/dehydratase family protein [Streptococcus massiliensis]|uniref:NAD-dependent epimerase/dehydratase family protein n=1 Tax=Streptococcus massiliensis TaxID=313439 RepID=UPI0009DA4E12
MFCSSIWAHGRAKALPLDANDPHKEPLCHYGKEKFKSELYLKKAYEEDGFPATIIMPGQISGAGWGIIGPWGNLVTTVIQDIADGKSITLPNLGMENIHHIHGEDVARLFYQAMIHRDKALGQSFHAVTGQSITLYGYARLLYDYFGKEAQISFLPWEEWQEQIADKAEVESAYLHLARSGAFDISRERELLDFQPRYSNVETIVAAIQSYVERGVISVEK